MRVRILAIVFLAACSNPGGEPRGPSCPDAGCAAGSVALGARQADGTASGTWTPATGSGPVEFTVGPTGSGATAVFRTADGTSLAVNLVDAEGVELTWTGVALDGRGPLDAAQEQALASLAADPALSAAIAAVPLELGCRDDVSPAELAALLVPWQMVLKYRVPGRRAAVRAWSDGASCAYLEEPGAQTAREGPVGLVLSHENPVPVVFGFFAFDQAGAVEAPAASSTTGALEALGVCGALCRGACGPDCEPRNCRTEVVERACEVEDGLRTGVALETRTSVCGVHAGCIDHDLCYDACNGVHGCDSWAAAVCRRDCDNQAIWKYGPINTMSWKDGGGPFTSEETYELPGVNAVDDAKSCPPGAAPTMVEYPYSGTLALDSFVLHFSGVASAPGLKFVGYRSGPEAHHLGSRIPEVSVPHDASTIVTLSGKASLTDVKPWEGGYGYEDGYQYRIAQPYFVFHVVVYPAWDDMTTGDRGWNVPNAAPDSFFMGTPSLYTDPSTDQRITFGAIIALLTVKADVQQVDKATGEVLATQRRDLVRDVEMIWLL